MRKGELIFRELDGLNDDYIEEWSINMKHKNRKNQRLLIASIALILIIPNVFPSFAKVLVEVPFIGKIFEVVTIVHIEDKNDLREVDVEVPSIVDDSGALVIDEVNDKTHEYIDLLLSQFYEDVGESRGALTVDYEVVTNSDTWFTISINSTEIQASGYERIQYYNIDKTTGEYKIFSDLFEDFEVSKLLINENIIEQMKKNMEDEDLTYFIKSIDNTGFESVTNDQNYYFSNDGNLVVAFDEYEVAPGYMGIVEIELSDMN